MKQLLFLLTLTALVSRSSAQGIDFFHGPMAEALQKAQKEDKIIFIDCFTEWCGPCKRMAATTFKDEKIGDFFNGAFVNMKIDMEKGEGPDLAIKYNVTAYPTYLFVNQKGEVVHQSLGAMQADAFLEVAKTAMGKMDNSKEFEKAYSEGKRDPDLILKYVRALNRAGKPSLKIVNDYLAKQPDLTQPDNLRIIFEGTTQADSKVFDLLVKNRDKVAALYMPQQVKDRIEAACQKTLQNATTYKNDALRKEAIDKMKMYCPDKADAFALHADMKYYEAARDPKNFCAACETYAKKQAGNNANQLYGLAKQISTAFPDDKNAMQDAEKYARKAAENGGLANYYYTYASILYKNGKKKDALENAQKSLQIAKDGQPQQVPEIEQLIEQIKG